MTEHKTPQQHPERLFRLIVISLATCIVSFILLYWIKDASFEFRDVVLSRLCNGLLAYGSLFVFLAGVIVFCMRKDNWVSGLAMMLSPFILLPVGLMTFIMLIMPGNKWTDDAVFCNGNESIIEQNRFDGDEEFDRIIKTGRADCFVRQFEILNDTTLRHNISTNNNVISYHNRNWQKR